MNCKQMIAGMWVRTQSIARVETQARIEHGYEQALK